MKKYRILSFHHKILSAFFFTALIQQTFGQQSTGPCRLSLALNLSRNWKNAAYNISEISDLFARSNIKIGVRRLIKYYFNISGENKFDLDNYTSFSQVENHIFYRDMALGVRLGIIKRLKDGEYRYKSAKMKSLLDNLVHRTGAEIDAYTARGGPRQNGLSLKSWDEVLRERPNASSLINYQNLKLRPPSDRRLLLFYLRISKTDTFTTRNYAEVHDIGMATTSSDTKRGIELNIIEEIVKGTINRSGKYRYKTKEVESLLESMPLKPTEIERKNPSKMRNVPVHNNLQAYKIRLIEFFLQIPEGEIFNVYTYSNMAGIQKRQALRDIQQGVSLGYIEEYSRVRGPIARLYRYNKENFKSFLQFVERKNDQDFVGGKPIASWEVTGNKYPYIAFSLSRKDITNQERHLIQFYLRTQKGTKFTVNDYARIIGISRTQSYASINQAVQSNLLKEVSGATDQAKSRYYEYARNKMNILIENLQSNAPLQQRIVSRPFFQGQVGLPIRNLVSVFEEKPEMNLLLHRQDITISKRRLIKFYLVLQSSNEIFTYNDYAAVINSIQEKFNYRDIHQGLSLGIIELTSGPGRLPKKYRYKKQNMDSFLKQLTNQKHHSRSEAK